MNKKIKSFISRNRIRNAKLYQPGLIKGVDFIECPVSNERLLIIRSDYITNILGMTVEEYDQKFPNVQKRCQAHRDNIKKGIQTIDPQTGLTKYQMSQIKARQVLTSLDENGVSGYKKKGQKTRATHMNKLDELGRNGYRRQADARLTTMLPNGLTVEENAHRKQKETLISNHKTGTGGASKISKKVLSPILNYLNEHNIDHYFDKTEYGIKCLDTGNYYFYDLTITQFNIAIEYQSSAWHSNPSWDLLKWNNWVVPKGKKKTAQDALQYDYEKAKALYKHRGITTYYVWEDSAKEDIEGILCLLKTQNMKY